MAKHVVHEDLFGEAPLKPSRDQNADRSYAAAAWRCDSLADRNLTRISIAWSVPEANRFRSGLTSFLTKFPKPAEGSKGFLPFVEESLGIVHHKPSDTEELWNAHVERLVADYLLFFVHRVFFGQCQRFWPALAGYSKLVDQILILGPTLHKFRGRICYLHFPRSKTLAIVSGEGTPGQPPEMGRNKWIEEPSPAFWHDYSSRRWLQEDAQNGGGGLVPRATSFEVVIPTGDGLSGKRLVNALAGAPLWRDKFEKVKTILDNDRDPVRLRMWSNRELFLPKGVAQAVRVLALADALRDKKNGEAAILQKATEERKQLEAAVERLAPMADRDAEQPDIRSLLFRRACEAHVKRRAMRVSNIRSTARRDAGDLEETVDSALSDIYDEFGPDLMSYSIHSLHEST